jgi:hypothetical protein
MALANPLLSVFMTNTNNVGDKGSPYPLLCRIGGPGLPLSITLVLVVEKEDGDQLAKPRPEAHLTEDLDKEPP